MGRRNRSIFHSERLLVSLTTSIVLFISISLGLGVQSGDRRVHIGGIDTTKYPKYKVELDRNRELVVPLGNISIFMNTSITMDNGNDTASVLIQNNKSNEYAQRIEFIDYITGEIIYNSGIVKPGYSIDEDRLNIRLSRGEYVYKVLVDILNKKGDLIKTINTNDVKIRVLN